MNADEKQKFIRQKAKEHIPEINEKILWSSHAVKKLRIETLRKKEIEACLKKCTIIENYKMEGRQLPGCLMLGFIDSNPVHMVIAVDMDWDRIFIITVYRPLQERWESDWKTRKR